MSPEKNKQIVRQAFEEIWNRRNLSVVDACLVSDYVEHTFTDVEGPDGLKRFVARMRSALADLRMMVEDAIAEGNKVVIRWTARGTHEGEFQGIPPTGKEVTISGVGVVYTEDGQLVEGWTHADMLGLLRRIGGVPEPKQEAMSNG